MKDKTSIKSSLIKYVISEMDIKRHETRKKIELYEENKRLRELNDLNYLDLDLDKDKGAT